MVSQPQPRGPAHPVSRAEHVHFSRRGVLGAVVTLAAAPFALQGLVSAAQGVADAQQPVGIAGVPDLTHEHAGQTHGIDVLARWRAASHISGPPGRYSEFQNLV